MKIKKILIGTIIFLGLYGLIVVTRSPQLLSPSFMLDGDECILGLMAKHLIDTKEVPIFFYGQNYAFCLIEAGCIALGFRLFGMSAEILRLSLLFFWSVGCWFLYFAVKKWSGKQVGLFTFILIVFLPAWAYWAMKGGGYLTSFVFVNIGLLIVAYLNSPGKYSNILWLLLGINCSVVYYSQPIWLIVLIPFVFYSLIRSKKFNSFIFMFLGVILIIGIMDFLTRNQTPAYWSPPAIGNPNFLKALRKLPERLIISLSSSYYLFEKRNIGFFTTMSGIIWTLIFLILSLLQFHRLIKRKFNLPTHLVFVSLLSIMSFSLLIRESIYGYRYLLPFSIFLIILFAFELTNLYRFKKYLSYTVILLLSIIGSLSLFEFKKFSVISNSPVSVVNERLQVDKLIEKLDSHKIHHVFCLDALYQWNIIFYSKEKILARWFSPVDRYPKYPQAVDQAFFSNKAIALVGFGNQFKDVYPIARKYTKFPQKFDFINERFFILYNPRQEILLDLGFRFFSNNNVYQNRID